MHIGNEHLGGVTYRAGHGEDIVGTGRKRERDGGLLAGDECQRKQSSVDVLPEAASEVEGITVEGGSDDTAVGWA